MPKVFHDADGREWNVTIDIPAAKEVFRRLQINLRSRNDIQRLTGEESVYLIPDVLYVLCEAQARKRYEKLADNTPELSAEFGRNLESRFVQACEALCAELSDFYRRLGLQATARLIEALANRLATVEAKEAAAYGDKLTAAMDAEIDKQLEIRNQTLDKILGTKPGNSPESSASSTLPE